MSLSITAGVGVIAIGLGVYMLVDSGSKTELRSGGTPLEARSDAPAPGLRLGSAF